MSSPQPEPSMEEILASIRKIISEDSAEPAPVAAMPAPAESDMDVLELTQEMAEPAAPGQAEELPKVEESVEARIDEVVFKPVARELVSNSSIFSDQTLRTMENTFGSIPDEGEEPAPERPQAAPAASDGASVESVFERAIRQSFEPLLQKYLEENSSVMIEQMKPLIREWMDENFPPLLENAVKGEVGRIVRARSRR